jgi:teichuronic acid biosynthesis glycosyltransferase TuaH
MYSGCGNNFNLPKMIQNRNIIIIGLQSWDIDIGSNCKNIAVEFARYNKVLYVNSPLDRLTILRNRKDPKVQKRLNIINGKESDLVGEQKNLWVFYPRTIVESISRLPLNGVFDVLNRINNIRFARQIRSAADRLDFKDVILFNDGNMFRGFYLKELIKPSLYIYYLRDNFLEMDYWKRQGKRIEPALMVKSDLVLTNSQYLANIAKKYNSRSFDTGQGCDLSLYNPEIKFQKPPDMENYPGPIIGYCGALVSLRLDIDLIRHIARSLPDWSIVMIGPEDDDFKRSDLHMIKNIYFLGNKRPEELPAYVNCFDVAINPQIINELTQANYPRKVDEYLAMGKPVVATRQETMSVFNGYAYLASDKEEYVALIQKAFLEDSTELEHQRERFARTHSWDKIVEKMFHFMEESISDKKIPVQ